MSRHRIRPDAGFVNVADLPKGPNGFALCRFCQKECPTKRHTFCSPECVSEWKIRTQPDYAAKKVLERDRGVCQQCNVDCVALLESLRRVRHAERAERFQRAITFDIRTGFPSDPKMPKFRALCDEHAIPERMRGLSRRLWEMDHVVPVVEGGGECGLEGLRTLCLKCHKAATAELAARRAAARRAFVAKGTVVLDGETYDVFESTVPCESVVVENIE